MAGGDIVAGAALGLPFNILYDVIKEVMNKTTMFKPLLGDLSSTMKALQPLINDVAKHNKDLGRPEEELQSFKKQMEDGAELLRKCSKVGLWRSYKKYGYANKLMELDKSLNRLLAILSVHGIRAGMETLVVVKETLTTVRRIEDNNVSGKEEKVVVHNLMEFQEGKLIGIGPFGPRYVASNRVTGALCSMKEVESSPNDSTFAKRLEIEIRVLSHLKHPHIVEYYGSHMVDNRCYIYQEYVHPGSLRKYMDEHYGAITESIVRNFTRQIMSGLAYLHSQLIVHRSIKGANLLVDTSGVVKLADFGMARLLSGHEGTTLEGENPYYWMAPEFVLYGRQCLAGDIWSLGCTVIEMLTGRPPRNAYESMEALFTTSSENENNPELLRTLSQEGRNFLECCLRINPEDRPTAAILLEHPFLTSSSS